MLFPSQTMRTSYLLPTLSVLFVLAGWWLLPRPGFAVASQVGPQAEASRFDKTGAQVGEQLPDLPVYDLEGKEHGLREVAGGNPALLLTSSLTCPKSRSTCPQAKELAAALGSRLPVVIIYVLEAHPKGDPSPYRGYEDVTPENRRDGILCRQPRSLNERLQLAKRFRDRLHVTMPVYVDAMTNAVWRQLGGGPNMGVLIGQNGVVTLRQGWFDAPSMQKAAEAFLTASRSVARGEDAQTERDRALTARLNGDGLQEWDVTRPFTEGDLPRCREMLNTYPELVRWVSPLMKGTGNETLLHWAVAAGRKEVVELLLSKNADVNAQNAHTPSPLHLAAANGNRPLIELLLKHGADVNRGAPAGPTPLQEAAIHNHTDVVGILLKSGATQNLFSHAASGHVAEVRQLLEQDPSRAVRPDGWDRTPLDYAAGAGRIEVAQLLLSYGVKESRPADAYPRDTAVHWAARNRQIEMVELLLSKGTTPNAAGNDGWTLLHMAASQKDAALARRVLDHRPDLQTLDMRGWAPLHQAAAEGSLEIAKLLIDASADVNVPSDVDHRPCALFEGTPPKDTPLHIAAENGQAHIAMLLLAHGADVNARDSAGKTPLDIAQSGGHESLVRLLIEHGAKPGDNPGEKN